MITLPEHDSPTERRYEWAWHLPIWAIFGLFAWVVWHTNSHPTAHVEVQSDTKEAR